MEKGGKNDSVMEIVWSMVRDTYVSFQFSNFLFDVKVPRILKAVSGQQGNFESYFMGATQPWFQGTASDKRFLDCHLHNPECQKSILHFLLGLWSQASFESILFQYL